MKVKKARRTLTDKQLAIEAISDLPDRVSMQQILDEIRILESLRQGEADIAAGRYITHEEMKRKIKEWLSK
jgi:predicted transcriptional regulator